jgi:chaperone BCS1
LDPLQSFLQHGLGSNQLLQGGLLVMVAGIVLRQLQSVPVAIFRFILNQAFTLVEVPNSTQAYEAIQQWVERHPRAQKFRRLSVSTFERQITGRAVSDLYMPDEPAFTSMTTIGSKKCRPRPVFTLAPGNHFLLYRGRLLWLTRYRWESQTTHGTEWKETFWIRVLGRDTRIARELVTEAIDRALEPKKDFVRVMVWQDGWQTISSQPPRPLESVVLPMGTVGDILADCQWFLASRKWYEQMGIPYRRGHLLHGVPGSGKSSLVFALAGELGVDVYAISLATGLNDLQLQRLLSQVPENSIILIEDIDAAFKKQDDREIAYGITFSGLLNAIDGTGAKEGHVLFMTTNHVEKLDPALIRPGRCDRKWEFSYATGNQAARLFERFFPEASATDLLKFADKLASQCFTMAELQAHLLKYRESIRDAILQPLERCPVEERVAPRQSPPTFAMPLIERYTGI